MDHTWGVEQWLMIEHRVAVVIRDSGVAYGLSPSDTVPVATHL